MKTNSYIDQFDYNSAYKKIIELKKSIDSEREEKTKEIISEELRRIFEGKEVIVKTNLNEKV